MFETETALDTWSIASQNSGGTSFSAVAKPLPPHRKVYLDYEGEVSNNRGCVRQVDTGTYSQHVPNVFTLNGQIFHGTVTIAGDVLHYQQDC
jgi:hypothetical protein